MKVDESLFHVTKASTTWLQWEAQGLADVVGYEGVVREGMSAIKSFSEKVY